MHGVDVTGRKASVAVWTSIVAAAAFEAVTVAETQDRAAWAISPWKNDPYHTAVYLAQVAVPVLATLILLRLLVRRALAEPDRAQQIVRAAGVMSTVAGLSLAFEWAAVIGRANPSSGSVWVPLQVAGLLAVTVLVAGAAVSLVRCRRPPGTSAQWHHEQWHRDWLGDAVILCRRLPVLGRLITPALAAWVRNHVMTVFAGLSALGGAAVAGAQAVGEAITDPVLLGWYFLVATAANLAFCMIGNAVAGFVVRTRPSPARAVVEASVVAGCVATLLAVAFHDHVWSAFTARPMSADDLVVLTLGIGVLAGVATAAALLARAARAARPARPADRG